MLGDDVLAGLEVPPEIGIHDFGGEQTQQQQSGEREQGGEKPLRRRLIRRVGLAQTSRIPSAPALPERHSSREITQFASSALVDPWPDADPPNLPRLRRTGAYNRPATAPANQRAPWMAPNASEETARAIHVTPPKETRSKSADTRRSRRYPRNANSSAMGTEITAP